MRRKVALIVETSTGYGRNILSGIVRYRRSTQWAVFLEQRDLSTRLPAWIENWHGDGVISRVTSQKLADLVRRKNIPLVELTDRGKGFDFPMVRTHDQMVGFLAADHLFERGFRNLAFCGFQFEAWSKRRESAFHQRATEKGGCCAVFRSPWMKKSAKPWEVEQEQLAQWIDSLAKPLGVMACNDVRGQQVLEACSRAGVTVPEEVAVIGVDDDQMICELCEPPLSSVATNAAVVGFRAAELLDQMMLGNSPADSILKVPPVGITVRQSTDSVAIADKDVAAALTFIRENACLGISVNDVLMNVPVSRSTLERQLRRYFSRSPQQEIRNVQVKRAKELLTETDLSMEQIAGRCGFEHPEYMHVVFKREVGITPGRFRRNSQAK